MYWKLLRNKNFMILWVTQIFTQLEVTVVDFTVAVVFANAATHDKNIAISAIAIIFALQFIPALPASLLAGTLADIFDKKRLILILNVFRCLFLLLFFFKSEVGGHLYIFVFVLAVCLHMYDVIEKSTLRNVVTEVELPAANGLFIVTSNATTLIGVVLSGLLEKAIGFQAILLSGAVLFAIASLLSSRLPNNLKSLSSEPQAVLYEPQRSFFISIIDTFKTIGASFKYLATVPQVWLSMIIVILVQGVTLCIASVSFEYGHTVLHIDLANHPEAIAFFLLIPVATGLALGGLFSPILTRKFQFKNLIVLIGLVTSILIIFFGVLGDFVTNLYPEITATFIVFELLIICIGIFTTIVQTAALELIQRFTAGNVRGKVFGILVGTSNSIAGIFVGLSGILVDKFHASNFALLLGVSLFIFFYSYRVLVKRVLKGQDFIIRTNNTSSTQ